MQHKHGRGKEVVIAAVARRRASVVERTRNSIVPNSLSLSLEKERILHLLTSYGLRIDDNQAWLNTVIYPKKTNSKEILRDK